MPISPSQGAQQLFESAFGHKAESPEEMRLLRVAPGFASTSPQTQTRTSAQPTSVTPQPTSVTPQPTSVTPQSSGMDEKTLSSSEEALGLLQKKMKQVDEAQKKLFGENLKLEIKKMLISTPEFKGLLAQETKLAGDVQTRKTMPDVIPGITDPVQAGQISLQQRGKLAELLTGVRQTMATQQTGVGNILDRIGKQQETELVTAQQGYTNALDYLKQAREQELQPLEISKLKAEIAKINNDIATGDSAWGDIISVEDAIKLGVPYGTTKGQAAGITPQTGDQVKRSNAVKSIKDLVQHYKDISNKVNTSNSRAGQLATRGVGVLNKTDVNAVRLNALKAQAAEIAKLFGDSGRLSDQDLARALLALPDWQTPKAAAEALISDFENRLNSLDTSGNLTSQEQLQVGDTIDVGGQQATILEILD